MRKQDKMEGSGLPVLSLFGWKYLVGSSFCISALAFSYFCARLCEQLHFRLSAWYSFVLCW